MSLSDLIPEVDELADLHLLAQDLRSVQAMCDRLLSYEKTPEPERDQLLVDALYSAAVVRYARCHVKGKRAPLPLRIFDPYPGAPETHAFYMELRHKLVAHSVNDFEQCKVALIVQFEADTPKGVHGVVPQSLRLVSHAADGIVTLGKLAQVCREYVEPRIQVMLDTVLEKAKQLTPEQLSTLKPVILTAPGPERAGKTRR